MTKNRERIKSRNKANLGLIIALCIVSACLIVTTTLWLVGASKVRGMGTSIENVYQRNFYDLVDNVNNAEVKLSKVLASNYDSYSKKMLGEISKNANSASYNLSNLPISLDGLDETKKFINQVSGYTDSLAEKLDKGQSLTSAELDTLDDIYRSMTILKENLGKFNDDIMVKGYNIFKNGNLLPSGYNEFTKNIQGIKSSDVEYPTMIYDGPFSDGQYGKEIKGLPKELISVGEAKAVILDIYQNISDKDIKFEGESNGKFNTFDFSAKSQNGTNYYIQITKNGGKLLTVSGYGSDKSSTRSMGISEAITMVKNLLNKQTGISFDCVWRDILGNDAYLNFAPVQAGIVLYPDLIKAKVNLNTGEMIGYSASAYYTNHKPRQIISASYGKSDADKKIPEGYEIQMSRLCLAPLDYGQEKLCYEYECTKNDATYYIYINAQTGITENILKVIETKDGSKLM